MMSHEMSQIQNWISSFCWGGANSAVYYRVVFGVYKAYQAYSNFVTKPK